MAEETLDEADWQAFNTLTDRFSLCPEHLQNLLNLASGNQVIVESALLVAQELGGSPYEGARQYLSDVLEPAKKNKKLDRAP
tara:strand:+ start:323 stop:568 length:246 start_codon:yes stop_codon:yes gene_type:complete